jgi:hypothetical protein
MEANREKKKEVFLFSIYGQDCGYLIISIRKCQFAKGDGWSVVMETNGNIITK